MNKEVKEICMKCELEFHKRGKGCAFRSLGNEYCDLIEDFNKSITNYQNQLEKLTQENNDLESKYQSKNDEYINTMLRLCDLQEAYDYIKEEKKYLQSVIEELEKWLKEMLDSEKDIFSVIRVKDVLDKLNELRSKE